MDQPARIEIEGGERVTLTWHDGSVTTLSAGRLRDACACADCRNSGSASRRGAIRLVAPMLVTIADARLVGGYGMNFTFSPDDHHTGIFTFDQLKSLGADSADTNT